MSPKKKQTHRLPQTRRRRRKRTESKPSKPRSSAKTRLTRRRTKKRRMLARLKLMPRRNLRREPRARAMSRFVALLACLLSLRPKFSSLLERLPLPQLWLRLQKARLATRPLPLPLLHCLTPLCPPSQLSLGVASPARVLLRLSACHLLRMGRSPLSKRTLRHKLY